MKPGREKFSGEWCPVFGLRGGGDLDLRKKTGKNESKDVYVCGGGGGVGIGGERGGGKDQKAHISAGVGGNLNM